MVVGTGSRSGSTSYTVERLVTCRTFLSSTHDCWAISLVGSVRYRHIRRWIPISFSAYPHRQLVIQRYPCAGAYQSSATRRDRRLPGIRRCIRRNRRGRACPYPASSIDFLLCTKLAGHPITGTIYGRNWHPARTTSLSHLSTNIWPCPRAWPAPVRPIATLAPCY